MNFPVIMQLLNVSLILKFLCVDEAGNKTDACKDYLI